MPATFFWQGHPAGRLVRGPRGPWYVSSATETGALPDLPRLMLPAARGTLVDRAVLVDGAGRRLLLQTDHGPGDVRLDAYEAATNGVQPFAHMGCEDDLDRTYAITVNGHVLALGVHVLAVLDPQGRPRAGYPRQFGGTGNDFWSRGATHLATTATGFVVGGGPLRAVEGYDMDGQRLFRTDAMFKTKAKPRSPRLNMSSELPTNTPGMAGLFVDQASRIWSLPHPGGTLAVLAPDGEVLHIGPLLLPESGEPRLRFPVGVDPHGRIWLEDAHGLAAVDPGLALPVG